jgi:hypothetical protein
MFQAANFPGDIRFFAVLKWNWVEAVTDLIETRNEQRKAGLPLRFLP